MGTGVIDQMLIMDAGRAGSLAGKAGQAAIDMERDLGGGRTVMFQHILDQIDAAAGAIEFVAQQRIGRAGRQAEAAMDAGPQIAFAVGDRRIGQLFGSEAGLHQPSMAMRPAPRMRQGSKADLTRRCRAARAGSGG